MPPLPLPLPLPPPRGVGSMLASIRIYIYSHALTWIEDVSGRNVIAHFLPSYSLRPPRPLGYGCLEDTQRKFSEEHLCVLAPRYNPRSPRRSVS